MLIVNQLPLPLEKAQQLIWDLIEPTDITVVDLIESEGYVLAEPVKADTDVPHFEKSMLDGFAVRVDDIRGASRDRPIRLKVIEIVPAGHVPAKEVIPGTAIRIMTGAMIPQGADAVCRFEMTRDVDDRTSVDVLSPVSKGEAIARIGEDVVRGTPILSKGLRIGPAEIGMLATFGYYQVQVYRKPVVGILSSGSELIEVKEPLSPGKIRNSNSYMVASQVVLAGGIPKLYQPVSDEADSLAATIRSALDEVDLLVTTGGVSVGDYDLMHEAFDKAGAEKIFWKVLIRPGSPVLFARKGNVPVIGMSGNPGAAFVNAELFLLPALRKMAGLATFERPVHTAKLLNSPIKKAIKPIRFLRGHAFLRRQELYVDLSGAQSSGVLSSFLGTNCLVRIEGGQQLQANETVSLHLYGGLGAERTGD
jgi:molybdopterin molybdotransferase